MTQGEDAVFLHLTAGQGPDECARAVGHLHDEIRRRAAARAVAVELLESAPGRREGCFSSMLLRLEGGAADAVATPFLGGVQWICPSPYRPRHNRKNWFVAVRRLERRSLDRVALEPTDIGFRAVKASGPGGQHVNKADSAVQAIHRPTGLRVEASEERSQHANKKRAVAKIRALLASRVDAARDRDARDRWALDHAVARGDPVLIFEGADFRERRRC